VTIALQPEGLGTVRATMTSTDDQLVVRIATSSPQADVAVRAALPELHASLGGGHQGTTVTLADSGSSSNPWANAQTNGQSGDQPASPDRFADRSPAETGLVGAAPTVGSSPSDTTTTTTSSTGLDVRM
jgi:flagellar hook-length control protein FliK